MQVETLPIETLIPYARNSRTHSDEQVAQVAASIREFGFTNPVLIDGDGGIIAGHGRVLAARKLGMAAVPCIRLMHLSEAQKRAYIIADNKLALNAGWDEQMLAMEFKELGDLGFDLEITGFFSDEIEEIVDDLDDYFDSADQKKTTSLSDRFLIPPFSVLNAREGWWQARKQAWIALGIRSEIGRGVGLIMEAEQVTAPGLNYYRDKVIHRPAAAHGRLVTTVKISAAMAEEGR